MEALRKSLGSAEATVGKAMKKPVFSAKPEVKKGIGLVKPSPKTPAKRKSAQTRVAPFASFCVSFRVSGCIEILRAARYLASRLLGSLIMTIWDRSEKYSSYGLVRKAVLIEIHGNHC